MKRELMEFFKAKTADDINAVIDAVQKSGGRVTNGVDASNLGIVALMIVADDWDDFKTKFRTTEAFINYSDSPEGERLRYERDKDRYVEPSEPNDIEDIKIGGE